MVVDNSSPLYRRKSETIMHKNQLISNEDVVPYNPYLIVRFNCHINIEICVSIKGVKYLYKYLYKGPDTSTMVIKGFDEVDNYIKNRTLHL